MKNFLLTWYGITDFRASLGFENTSGPIVGALAERLYTDAIILGYTRMDNDFPACIHMQRSFSTEWEAILSSRKESDWGATSAFTSKFANTNVAHEHFIRWLKEKTAGTGARIHFHSEKLRELNDTEGIYACAMRALELVAQEPGNKQITLYLSPGTPVMAFVWAFAALNYPDLKKRLIASSVVGKPPEVITLPAEWIERHGEKKEVLRLAVDEGAGFDVTYHLFGEQRMPALLGIRQFNSKHHVFLNSPSYPAACMKPFIQEGGFAELTVDPWNARDTRETIISNARRLPPKARIGINLTGGTKLMFAGALSAARALGAIPFYFDSPNRCVTFIDSLRREKIKPIESVEPFLKINSDGLKLARKCDVDDILLPERRKLIETLWEQRHNIVKLYKELNKYCSISTPFYIKKSGFELKLDNKNTATIQGYGLDLIFDNWPEFAQFLCGGWLEEYIYLLFKPYEDTGVIYDLRINVRLELTLADHKNINVAYNEIDIAFTDGYSLYIVECKAGNVAQEQVMKLQNLVRIYGGVEGRGILVSCFPPHSDSVKKKIKDARLTLLQGSKTKLLSQQIKSLMDEVASRAKVTGISK